MEEDKLSKAIDLLINEIKIYDQYYCLATSQALKTVLNELDRLKKENEELHKEIDRMKSLDIYKLVEDWETGQLIPRQKIKDKIEKLNDVSNAEELEDTMDGRNYTITELVQYVLQELLESEE